MKMSFMGKKESYALNLNILEFRKARNQQEE